MDWNIRANDRVFFLLQYDNARQPAVIDPISPLFNVYYSGPWWQAQFAPFLSEVVHAVTLKRRTRAQL